MKSDVCSACGKINWYQSKEPKYCQYCDERIDGQEDSEILQKAKAIQKFFHEYQETTDIYKGIEKYASDIVEFIKEAE